MLWNNTNICLYSLDKTKWLWYNARVQADMLPVLFCCTFKYRYSSFTREFSADMTAPQSAMLCMDFSAKCAAPEPSERRAIMGFYKFTNFLTCKALIWLLFFVRQWGAFLWYNFSEKADFLFAWKRCAMKGSFKCTIFYAVEPVLSRIFGRAIMGFISVQF